MSTNTYTVTFEYRVEDAASLAEAAEQAYAALTARRPVATVTSEHGHSDDIDLEAGEWMARELGAQHGSEDTAPFGDLDDAGSGDLMTALGETGETTEDNYGYRVGLLNAYREAWEKAAGRHYPIG